MTSWRQIQRTNITRWEELNLDTPIPTNFPLNIPRRLAEKIDPSDPHDPILLQFLPTHTENQTTPGFANDAVGDKEAQKTPRLLHKYAGRVLLTTTSACAMHCRFCFRRHFPYEKNPDFTAEIAYIASNPTIHEVILSGGDPLSLSDDTLNKLLTALDAIPHLKLIRFHSRFPIGIPERITPALIDLMHGKHQRIFVLHCNHPRELDNDILTALKKLGIPLLNQSVLLKGVNDSYDTLHELFLTLASNGIQPYYLHQLDRVTGTAHFEVSEEKGLALIEQLQNSLPGYAVPKYVREIAGAKCKTVLHSQNSFQAEQFETFFQNARR